MDSCWQALQTNGKFFLNFELIFKLMSKNKNIQMNSDAWVLINVDVLAKSIDLARQALQAHENLQISEYFFELTTIFKILVALGLCMQGGEGICADQHAL